ncbi:MAG: Gfo/Idh/MocA family oxidoreductase [Aestuariivita sp.]|nr:Gfo/Idh/MocA family oxidoreductase [Aestuariivita sp.]MCY4201162.1 Gfo/Idh/MocA family oxidoreductase [Aestuariivita sp.]
MVGANIVSSERPRRLRLGMVGGGNDAFIGAVHRTAARIDDHFTLLAGALSSTPSRSRESGEALGLDRVYDDYKQMAIREARLKAGVEVVAIVTPNDSHYPIAREFLKRGIHVICDKPLTSTLDDANKLLKTVNNNKAIFVLSHNYTCYPLIRQAREMVTSGYLGQIRVVQVEYVQDWLTEVVNNKQAEWRTDPMRSGEGGAIGDIGTHAYNLVRFVTGLKVEQVSADLQAFVVGRLLDDNAHVMLRFEDGVRGMLWASQVAPGNENGLRLRVYGDKGGIEWAQEEPNLMWYTPYGCSTRKITRNCAETLEAANRLSRIPPGHPEGYLEGFANLYSEAAAAIRAFDRGEKVPLSVTYPTVQDGLDGMRFISACVKSSRGNSRWVKID